MLKLRVASKTLPNNPSTAIKEPPTIYNNQPVFLRMPPSCKRLNNIEVTCDGFRLQKCTEGYVVLCTQANCSKLFYCAQHELDNRLYRKCQYINCQGTPRYGYFNKRALFCVEHRPVLTFNTAQPKCHEANCYKQPGYGYEGKERISCFEHKAPDMLDIKTKKCKYEGCGKQPSFANEGDSPIYCATHKELGMVNVICRRCQQTGCRKVPIFGIEGENPKYCSEHKLEMMVNVVNKRCIYEECRTKPSFGYTEGKATYCAKHKLEGMANVISPRCLYPACNTMPTYGIIWMKPQYCVEHKQENMINVVTKRCEYPGCDIRCSFGYEGKDKRYCSEHKLDGMINLANKLCEYDNCGIQARFGFGGSNALRCSKHKLDGMIDLYRRYCDYPDCNIQPIFGYEGGSEQYCSAHKLEGMVDIKNAKCMRHECKLRPCYAKLFSSRLTYCCDHSTLNDFSLAKCSPICVFIGCPEVATYVIDGDDRVYPIRCAEHKLVTDIALSKRLCPQCNEELYFPDNKRVCMDCGKYRARRLYHFKEQLVRDFLSTNNQQFTHDKRISNTGSTFRPDFLIPTSFGYLIIEVDEFQHKVKVYDSAKEESRMRCLYRDVQLLGQGKQVLFLRFNPDPYNGPKFDLKARLQYLFILIKHFETISDIGLDCGKIYLYYDGFSGKDVKIERVNEVITTEWTEELDYTEDDD